MFIEIIATFPDESPALSWIWYFLSGSREAFDAAVIVFLCLPRITKFSKWIPLLVAALVFVFFALFVIFLGENKPCPWCSQHFPSSNMSYIFLGEGLISLVLAIWAWKRPFEYYNPRPACFIMCVFWTPIYLVLAIVMPIMRSQFDQGLNVDWGFCLIIVVICVYYVLFVIMLYIVIVKDSRYVFHNKLDDDLLHVERIAGNAFDSASTARLIQKYPITELVDLLSEKALTIIPYKDLQIEQRVGMGAFGEGSKKKREGRQSLIFFLAQKCSRQIGMEPLLLSRIS